MVLLRHVKFIQFRHFSDDGPEFGSWLTLKSAFAMMLVISCGSALAVLYKEGIFSVPVTVASKPAQEIQLPTGPKLDTLQRPAHLSAQESRQAAYSMLFTRWGVTIGPGELPDACLYIELIGMGCLDAAGNLDMLRRLNRPAVLKLQDGRGEKYYAALTALQGDTAVVHVGPEKRIVPVSGRDSEALVRGLHNGMEHASGLP